MDGRGHPTRWGLSMGAGSANSSAEAWQCQDLLRQSRWSQCSGCPHLSVSVVCRGGCSFGDMVRTKASRHDDLSSLHVQFCCDVSMAHAGPASSAVERNGLEGESHGLSFQGVNSNIRQVATHPASLLLSTFRPSSPGPSSPCCCLGWGPAASGRCISGGTFWRHQMAPTSHMGEIGACS